MLHTAQFIPSICLKVLPPTCTLSTQLKLALCVPAWLELPWHSKGLLANLEQGELVQVRESSAEQGKVHLVTASLPFSAQLKLLQNGQSFAMWLRFYQVVEALTEQEKLPPLS